MTMYKKWSTNPIQFLAMTGYSVRDFLALIPYFKEAHNNYFSKFELNGKRKKQFRKFVIYGNSPLPTVEDRLAFILSYKKLNPIQQLQAFLFDMTQKQCNQFVHSLTIVLEDTLTNASVMPATTAQQLLEKLQNEEEIILFHDGTEREIPRPVDEDAQKENYSGKKKKHTLKNGLIVTTLLTILFMGATVSGSTHDKKIADQQYYAALESAKAIITLFQDTGYQGFAPEGVIIKQGSKKQKGKELTIEQKQNNKALSSIRIMVEHAIGSIKRYRIVKDECRLRKNRYPYKIMAICAGLHNFRIERNPVNYPEIKLT